MSLRLLHDEWVRYVERHVYGSISAEEYNRLRHAFFSGAVCYVTLDDEHLSEDATEAEIEAFVEGVNDELEEFVEQTEWPGVR